MNYKCYDFITNYKKIQFICENEYAYFLNKPNVQGVGLGYKVINGFCTNEQCIKVFVSKKIPKNYLFPYSSIPILYKGIKTDVVESGIFETHSLKDKIRPVLGGYSIGSVIHSSGGSMTCLVYDQYGYYILSCNHVLAGANTIPLGGDIVQPSIVDKGIFPRDRIANLARFVPLKFKTSISYPANYTDCAIARVTNISLVSSKIAYIGKIMGITEPSLDLSIRKIGKSTNVTYGNISAMHASFYCNVPLLKKKILFKDQLITSCLSESGDSGAPLLDLNNNIVGMLVGGKTGSFALCTPITTVLKSLNVSLVL